MKKMLVPLDGSDRAMNTVRYITKIEPFLDANIVLFNVFSSVPEGFWDLETDPRSTTTVKQVHAWEAQQRKNIQDYMDGARRLLLNAGADADAVKVKIQNRKTGFARDIIREARNGYDLVITRRRGMTGMRGIVLGSVATKLVEKLSFLPLLLAGRKPPGRKILVAFDGSEGAWGAVDFVGTTMAGFDFEIKLINIIRGQEAFQQDFQRLYAPVEHTELRPWGRCGPGVGPQQRAEKLRKEF